MKKIFNNKLTIILAILLGITLIISIILFNKTNLLKIEKEKIEQLTTSGTEFISTTQHLKEMEQASQAPKNIKRITLPNSSSIDVKEYTDQWANLTNENFSVDIYYRSTGSSNAGHSYGGTASANGGSVTTNYNNTTGILSISFYNPSASVRGFSDNNVLTTTISTAAYGSIRAVYLYLSE